MITFVLFVILIMYQMHKDIQELREAVTAEILPKEYGGEIPLSEMIGTMISLTNLSSFFYEYDNE